MGRHEFLLPIAPGLPRQQRAQGAHGGSPAGGARAEDRARGGARRDAAPTCCARRGGRSPTGPRSPSSAPFTRRCGPAHSPPMTPSGVLRAEGVLAWAGGAPAGRAGGRAPRHHQPQDDGGVSPLRRGSPGGLRGREGLAGRRRANSTSRPGCQPGRRELEARELEGGRHGAAHQRPGPLRARALCQAPAGTTTWGQAPSPTPSRRLSVSTPSSESASLQRRARVVVPDLHRIDPVPGGDLPCPQAGSRWRSPRRAAAFVSLGTKDLAIVAALRVRRRVKYQAMIWSASIGGLPLLRCQATLPSMEFSDSRHLYYNRAAVAACIRAHGGHRIGLRGWCTTCSTAWA